MKLSAAEQKRLKETQRLMREWRAWHREQLEEALAGPHGDVLARLMRLLENLEAHKPSSLLTFVRERNWRDMAYSVRLIALHEINTATTSLRERRGLPPFDDPLPGEGDTLSLTIKALLS
jgi:hypothetical protein